MAKTLKSHGFRRRANYFDRTTPAGFKDIVSLQAGTGHLQGKVTVNMGVYIPAVGRLFDGNELKERPKVYECQIRIRLSRLAYGNDKWFDRELPTAPQEVSSLITSCAIPFFQQFTSLKVIAEGSRSGQFPEKIVTPALLAGVLVLMGLKEEARAVLLKRYAENPALMKRCLDALGLSL